MNLNEGQMGYNLNANEGGMEYMNLNEGRMGYMNPNKGEMGYM